MAHPENTNSEKVHQIHPCSSHGIAGVASAQNQYTGQQNGDNVYYWSGHDQYGNHHSGVWPAGNFY